MQLLNKYISSLNEQLDDEGMKPYFNMDAHSFLDESMYDEDVPGFYDVIFYLSEIVGYLGMRYEDLSCETWEIASVGCEDAQESGRLKYEQDLRVLIQCFREIAPLPWKFREGINFGREQVYRALG